MRLLLTGDSIIARKEGLAEPRLNATLKSMHPGWQIENTAVSGINSEALLVQLPQLVLQQPAADAVVILVGTNDLARNKQVPLARYRQNLAGIAARVAKHTLRSGSFSFRRRQWMRPSSTCGTTG